MIRALVGAGKNLKSAASVKAFTIRDVNDIVDIDFTDIIADILKGEAAHD